MNEKWHDPVRWTHPSLGTYRLTKMADNEGGYHLWRYDLGGWLFVRVEHGTQLDAEHAYLGEDDEYTYWKK